MGIDLTVVAEVIKRLSGCSKDNAVLALIHENIPFENQSDYSIDRNTVTRFFKGGGSNSSNKTAWWPGESGRRRDRTGKLPPPETSLFCLAIKQTLLDLTDKHGFRTVRNTVEATMQEFYVQRTEFSKLKKCRSASSLADYLAESAYQNGNQRVNGRSPSSQHQIKLEEDAKRGILANRDGKIIRKKLLNQIILPAIAWQIENTAPDCRQIISGRAEWHKAIDDVLLRLDSNESQLDALLNIAGVIAAKNMIKFRRHDLAQDLLDEAIDDGSLVLHGSTQLIMKNSTTFAAANLWLYIQMLLNYPHLAMSNLQFSVMGSIEISTAPDQVTKILKDKIHIVYPRASAILPEEIFQRFKDETSEYAKKLQKLLRTGDYRGLRVVEVLLIIDEYIFKSPNRSSIDAILSVICAQIFSTADKIERNLGLCKTVLSDKKLGHLLSALTQYVRLDRAEISIETAMRILNVCLEREQSVELVHQKAKLYLQHSQYLASTDSSMRQKATLLDESGKTSLTLEDSYALGVGLLKHCAENSYNLSCNYLGMMDTVPSPTLLNTKRKLNLLASSVVDGFLWYYQATFCDGQRRNSNKHIDYAMSQCVSMLVFGQIRLKRNCPANLVTREDLEPGDCRLVDKSTPSFELAYELTDIVKDQKRLQFYRGLLCWIEGNRRTAMELFRAEKDNYFSQIMLCCFSNDFFEHTDAVNFVFNKTKELLEELRKCPEGKGWDKTHPWYVLEKACLLYGQAGRTGAELDGCFQQVEKVLDDFREIYFK